MFRVIFVLCTCVLLLVITLVFFFFYFLIFKVASIMSSSKSFEMISDFHTLFFTILMILNCFVECIYILLCYWLIFNCAELIQLGDFTIFTVIFIVSDLIFYSLHYDDDSFRAIVRNPICRVFAWLSACKPNKFNRWKYS